MTSNPDRVVEIMAREMRGDSWERIPEGLRDEYRDVARKALAALEAAGLRMLPIVSTPEMNRAAQDYDDSVTAADTMYWWRIWSAMESAFNPTTYTPEQSDD